MIHQSVSKETKLSKEMCRIPETLCKDKWTPMQFGENCFNPNQLCPELALSWEKKFILLGFQIDSRVKLLKENYKNALRRFMENGLDTDSRLKAASQLPRHFHYPNLPM